MMWTIPQSKAVSCNVVRGSYQQKKQRVCQPIRAKRKGSSQGFLSKEEASELAAKPWPEWPNPPDIGQPIQEQGLNKKYSEEDKATIARELESFYHEETAEGGDSGDVEDMMREMGHEPPPLRPTQANILRTNPRNMITEKTGEPEQMQVEFRETDPWNMWLWFEMYTVPTSQDADMLTEIVTSWFMLGRLGAFNGQNMQIYWASGDSISHMQYDTKLCDSESSSLFHDMSNFERKGKWLRVWINMGTADEFALDMLINALSTFSKENVGIKKMCIGGMNDDWPLPQDDGEDFSRDLMQAQSPFST